MDADDNAIDETDLALEGGAERVSLEQLYRLEAPRLRRRLCTRIKSADDANDIVQDAFARLLGSGAMARLRTPEAFLNRIVSNLVADRARQASSRGHHVPIDTQNQLAVAAEQTERLEIAQMHEQYRAAVAALPARTREVFVLHRVEELSYKQIATRLEISPRTVEWHISEAIVRIARTLEGQ